MKNKAHPQGERLSPLESLLVIGGSDLVLWGIIILVVIGIAGGDFNF